jgi:hypothetical protein
VVISGSYDPGKWAIGEEVYDPAIQSKSGNSTVAAGFVDYGGYDESDSQQLAWTAGFSGYILEIHYPKGIQELPLSQYSKYDFAEDEIITYPGEVLRVRNYSSTRLLSTLTGKAENYPTIILDWLYYRPHTYEVDLRIDELWNHIVGLISQAQCEGKITYIIAPHDDYRVDPDITRLYTWFCTGNLQHIYLLPNTNASLLILSDTINASSPVSITTVAQEYLQRGLITAIPGVLEAREVLFGTDQLISI